MQEILNELIKIKGVIGAFILEKDGTIAANAGKFGTIPIKSMADEIKAFARTPVIDKNLPKWIQFSYQNMIVLILNRANVLIVTLYQPNVEVALIRLTLEVATSKLKK